MGVFARLTLIGAAASAFVGCDMVVSKDQADDSATTQGAESPDDRGMRLVADEPERADVTLKALVIGNAAYSDANARLDNPVRDAELIAGVLREVGFGSVTQHVDLTRRQLRRAVNQFVESLGDDDQAVVYYAGHGIELDGMNYLLPVDFDARNEDDAKDEAYSVDTLVGRLTRPPRTGVNLIILDACRNDPFSRSWTRAGRSNGLAPPRDIVDTTAFWFATAPGDVAADGSVGNSPFAAALAAALRVPSADTSFSALYMKVSAEVVRRTNGRQRPYKREQLLSQVYLSARAEPEAPRAVAAAEPQPAQRPEQSSDSVDTGDSIEPARPREALRIDGALTAEDSTLSSGEYFDSHSFNWNAGETIVVEATSTEFDTYLIVQPPANGRPLQNDDRAPGNTNASVSISVTHSGQHRVIVSSYQTGETGSYQLIITDAE